jgi:cytidine deaminase
MEELTQYSDLIQHAAKVQGRAYAPYSGFKVGAAVRTSAGKIFAGANVENASYGMTICAERAAVAAAVAAGERQLTTIAIVTDSAEPAVPCGGCRQILAEFNPAIEIICSTTDGKQERYLLSELLPRANQGLRKHV